MAQLSIALDSFTESSIARELQYGDFASKSALVKSALTAYMRELAYQRVLLSQREYAEGKTFSLKGSLKDHIRKTRV